MKIKLRFLLFAWQRYSRRCGVRFVHFEGGRRCTNYNYNYKMAPSKRGAGGGSATHKEPT